MLRNGSIPSARARPTTLRGAIVAARRLAATARAAASLAPAFATPGVPALPAIATAAASIALALATLAVPALPAMATAAASGTADPAALLVRARSFADAGRYRQSDSLAWLAVDAMRGHPPRTDAERFDWLGSIAACAYATTDERCDSAAAWARRVADRRDAERSSAREEAWYSAGRAYQRDSHADSALACFERAIAAMRARADRTPAEEARLFQRIAVQHLAAVRGRDMLRTAGEAIGAWQRARGADSVVLALALVPRGRVRAETGAIDSARADLDLARSVLLRRLGPDHGELIYLWRTLAALRGLTDDPKGGVAAIGEALRLTALTRPPGDPETIYQNGQACALLSSAGDYVGACRYGRLAVAAADARFGRVSSRAATARLALANALRHVGDLATALAEAREAVDDQQQVLPALSGERAYGLSTLASIEMELRQFRAAHDDHAEAVRIRSATLPAGHPQLLYSLSAQAEASIGLGRYAEAETLLARVAGAQEALGPNPDLVDTWSTLASVKLELGRPDLALGLIDRAVGMETQLYGEGSEPVEQMRTNRLPILRAASTTREALDEALALCEMARRHVWWMSASVSEREALAAAEERTEALGYAAEFAREFGAPADAASRTWQAWARSRALVYRVQSQRRARRAAQGPAAAAFARADSARAELARTLLQAAESDAAGNARRDSLRREAEDAERELAGVAGPGVQAGDEFTLDAALGALPRGECVVAFARYRVHGDLHSAGAAPPALRFAYAAFVGGPGVPARVVSLGPAPAIEERVARWNALAARAARGAAAESSLALRTREAGSAVRTVLWDPVAAFVAGASRVSIVPDGAVANVDFATLPLPSGDYLAETGPPLAALATEQDLLPRTHDGHGLLAVGAPDFDRGIEGVPLLAASVERSAIPDSVRLHFGALPASGQEAREASLAWSGSGAATASGHAPPPATAGRGEATTLLGADASEAAVRADAPSRAVLHLATHGFMVDGKGAAAPDSGRRGVGALVDDVAAERPIAGSVDWSVAGLALAGANTSGPDRAAADDGYLTGAEIASLDLGRVRCAVLSACRTGAAQADRFESLQGLERALRIAGAGRVVMSLWPVEDADAREWMRAFYAAWRRPGATTSGAVREADLARLHALRVSGVTPRPARWAPFFARGERE